MTLRFTLLEDDFWVIGFSLGFILIAFNSFSYIKFDNPTAGAI